MLKDYPLEQLVRPLLEWYPHHARVLPWREEPAPYRVWVSEIMLQQTRVEAVKPYFERFMKELPDIASLARCPQDRLLKLWEGLGYYNRVRNMQKAARTVMEQYGGVLPADYEALLKLSGIGNYTAGAIASIAYGIPVPAVDGNVLRILMRVSEDDSDILKQSVKKEAERALQPVIPKEQAGLFTQAMMELGATVCVPNGEPKCTECPWQPYCLAGRNHSYAHLPKKAGQSQER
ncbi:Adenine DNA glycosylase [Eubacterium plexicaudatum ASF492]|nr:Adenine DNA glycosylase [Eubacterium plexicaudatum ASF492]